MNYNEKITEVSNNIATSYQELLKNISTMMNREEYTSTKEGVTLPINENEANNIDRMVNSLKKDINTFNYYTEFYPNKQNIWSKEIALVDHISNIIDKLLIS